MNQLTNPVRSALEQAATGLQALLNNDEMLANIAAVGQLLADSLKSDGRVYSCGNGGSMCDAMHFAEELTGRFRQDRPALAATAISDPGYLSCVSNDYGYSEVFARYIAAHGHAGDCLLAISTSGTSENVIKGVNAAKQKGLKVFTLTGRPHSALGVLADYDICTPAGEYADRVQELHIKVIHILIEIVERQLFPDNYAASIG